MATTAGFCLHSAEGLPEKKLSGKGRGKAEGPTRVMGRGEPHRASRSCGDRGGVYGRAQGQPVEVRVSGKPRGDGTPWTRVQHSTPAPDTARC
jgi:hypothetical protein